MIYITGDTHMEFGRFSAKRMRRTGMELTEKDYIIICGDFGLCWAKDKTFEYYCRIFAQKPYTILWVQGNHENYDMIAEYPVEEWHGGKVRHIVRDKVILLERGQVFEIDGKTFFTFGGASSHDIQGGILDRNSADFAEKKRLADRSGLSYRILKESWWPQELPTEEEMQEGLRNLDAHHYEVDYVITHCCATSLQNRPDAELVIVQNSDVLTDYLDIIEQKLHYKHWYFGHYHQDKKIDDRHTLLYYAILALDQEESVNEVPILGRPRYTCGDVVRFRWGIDGEKTGTICIVDAHGTFEQNREPSYDILVEEEKCLFKHICESEIIEKVKGEYTK